MASPNFFQTQFLPLGLHVWPAGTRKESPKPTKLHMTPFGLPLLHPVSTTGTREMKTSLTEGSTRCSQQTHTIRLGLSVLSSRSNLPPAGDQSSPECPRHDGINKTIIIPPDCTCPQGVEALDALYNHTWRHIQNFCYFPDWLSH